MAESIVQFVLGRLADAAIKEVLFLHGVGKQVETMRRELNRIQAFLKDADRSQDVDERQKTWVKEVRDVAYWIEDVIDTFLLEVAGGPQNKPRKRDAVKRMLKLPIRLAATHKLGDEINQIQARLKEINESRFQYAINNLGYDNGKRKRLLVKPPVLPDVDDPDVIGFEADTINIVDKLLDQHTTRRSVVAIVGSGGLGKTALALKVYNSVDVKRQFGSRIWITISRAFNILDLLRKLVEQLQPIGCIEQDKGEDYFLTKLYRLLKEKKYLLVLDDIWTNDVWTLINRALPNANNGSRILITTRVINVAKEADPACEPYKLQFLAKKLSLELLLKKAHPNEDLKEGYPDDLFNLAEQFATKCGGLPLALVVLGGLLSKKPFEYVAWSKVMKTMNWRAKGRECFDVLATSYEDLPFAIKSCFMYFASFPEDHKIDAKSLLQMWIAEGFILQEENESLEDTAESFLDELVQRSMVEVSQRYDDGSVKYCHIHDLLHDVAIQKAKEDNFLTVCSIRNGQKIGSRARRVAVHHSDCDKLLENASPNIRTLLCFNSLPYISKHKLLKVLVGHKNGKMEFDNLKGLTQLRYVKLGWWTDTSSFFHKKLQDFIGEMNYLQTLDLREGQHDDLPDCIWQVKTLRHIMLFGYTSGPSSAAELTNLRTLTGVTSRQSWDIAGLPTLTNLCCLDIRPQDQSQWGTVAAFLSTLKHLVFLAVGGRNIPIEIVDTRHFPFYQNLQTLCLRENSVHFSGSDMIFPAGMYPIHLTELTLEYLQLRQDPMPGLEKLQSLRRLKLVATCDCKNLICSAGGFIKLEYLEISESKSLEGWQIEHGAMSMLKQLKIQRCPMLRVPQLQNLITLRNLYWDLRTGAYGIERATANLIRQKGMHIPYIHITGFVESDDEEPPRIYLDVNNKLI